MLFALQNKTTEHVSLSLVHCFHMYFTPRWLHFVTESWVRSVLRHPVFMPAATQNICCFQLLFFFFFLLFKLPVFGFQVVTVMRYMSGPAGLSPGLPCLFQKFNPALKWINSKRAWRRPRSTCWVSWNLPWLELQCLYEDGIINPTLKLFGDCQISVF